MKLEINGLREKEDGDAQEKVVSIAVSPQTDLRHLLRDHPDLADPDFFSLENADGTKTLSVHGTINAPQQQKLVEVVQGPSNFAEGKINLTDTFAAFRDLGFRQRPVSAKLSASGTAASKTLIVDDNLEIRFHRTIRLPDDDRIHPLPPSNGTFPLFNVNAFSHVLPEKTVAKGGVFFPMWQREALWIEFEAFEHLDSAGPTEYAVRINLGEINAITGRPIQDPSDVQDYVLVPGQNWVDGILVEPGVVRQFVAMPLGRGYTVEGQITGEEKIGGLQIEVTPRVSRGVYTDTRFSLPGFEGQIDVRKSPHDEGIAVGSGVSMEWDHRRREPTVSDLVGKCLDEDFDRSFVLKASYVDDPIRSLKRKSDGLASVSFTDLAAVQSGPYAQADPPVAVRTNLPTLHRLNVKEQQTPTPASGAGHLFKAKKSSHVLEREEEGKAGRSDDEPGKSTPADALRNMGIAAGGKLVQDIYKDASPGPHWQKARTRLINVQIFDAATFEAATHIVPPPTPVTAKAYADAGHPFWAVEEDPENRVGPSEVLSAVKSVSALDGEAMASEDQGGDVDPSKPTKCATCERRLCDCVIRPCNHQFCSECVTAYGTTKRCPTCGSAVKHVAGFAAPMNLPGEETYKVNVPVAMLEVQDGRPSFRELQDMRL